MNSKTVLIAPEMVNLAETHRMASFARVFHESGHRVVVLGEGRYDYLFNSLPCRHITIGVDTELMNEQRFRMMHQLDEYGMDWISADELSQIVKAEVGILRELRLLDALKRVLADSSYRDRTCALSRSMQKYRTDPSLYPPLVGVGKILHFIDNRELFYPR